MNWSTTSLRRLFASRSVAVLFVAQIVLLLATLAFPANEWRFEIDAALVLDIMAREAVLVNEVIQYLLPPDLKSEDWWMGLLALPVVYYITAVVIAIPGRKAYRSGQAQR